jgi:hypothetical protein
MASPPRIGMPCASLTAIRATPAATTTTAAASAGTARRRTTASPTIDAGEQPPVLVVVLDLVRLPGQRRVDAVPAELDQRRHRDHGHHGQCRRARSPQPLPQITKQLHSAQRT